MADYSDPLGLLFGGVDYFGSPQQGKGLLQLTPQEIERMAAAQSPAFGVFPQMQPYRSKQDITASANAPVDFSRGRFAGTAGLFGDVVNQPIPMVRPLQLLSQALTGQQKYPDTEYFLENLPLKSDTPIGNVAGRIGSFAPINPMPAVRGAQKLGSLLGEEIGTRVATGRPLLPSLLQEPQTAMFAAPPAEQMSGGLLQAEVSPLGFYSAVEQQALKIPRKQGTGESFLNDLLKGQDVKKYEIEAMGLDTYLKGKPNVTRQEVQDFIANNRVDVQEVRYGALTPEDQAQKELLNNRYRQLTDQIETAKLRYEEGGIPYSELRKTMSDISKERTGIEESLSAFQGEAPRFGQYQLAGGENYRELLLTLPFKEPAMPKGYQVSKIEYDDGTTRFFAETPTTRSSAYKTEADANAELQRMTEGLKDFRANLQSFKSQHFDEPNVLAHLRVNDRIDAEGKKMLLIEEVQSDWHQAGREKGYKTSEPFVPVNKLPENFSVVFDKSGYKLIEEPSGKLLHSTGGGIQSIMSEEDVYNQWAKKKYEEKKASQIPDAPFKDTWYQLALKRAIKEAVDKGYDRIGLTTGAQQAQRYDLSKQVDNLLYSKNTDGTYRVSAQVQGRGQMIGEAIPEAKLSDYVGKEVAEKMFKGTGKQTEVAGEYDPVSMTSNKKYMTELSGIDLKVGGEGMKKYYDEIYPNFLNKYGKKYGASVGETRIKTGRGVQGGEKVRYLDITPEMKKAVQGGQPLASVEGMTGLLA